LLLHIVGVFTKLATPVYNATGRVWVRHLHHHLSSVGRTICLNKYAFFKFLKFNSYKVGNLQHQTCWSVRFLPFETKNSVPGLDNKLTNSRSRVEGKGSEGLLICQVKWELQWTSSSKAAPKGAGQDLKGKSRSVGFQMWDGHAEAWPWALGLLVSPHTGLSHQSCMSCCSEHSLPPVLVRWGEEWEDLA
jgi:hypothetical protein